MTGPGPDHDLEDLIGPENSEPGTRNEAPARDDDYTPEAIDRDQADDDEDGHPT